MPIYEYRCRGCHHRFRVLHRSFSQVAEPVCPHCAAADAERLISRVVALRSADDRLDSLGDPSGWGDLDEEDPRAMARWARRMGEEAGEDLGPEWDEMVNKMEDGELPDEGAGGDDELVD